MSTKCTIGYDIKNFHLYEECFDRDQIYLELNGDCFEIVDSFSSKHEREITIGVDVTTWRKIVQSWIDSHWGKNPQLDHEEQKIDIEYINKLIENDLRVKAKKEIEE